MRTHSGHWGVFQAERTSAGLEIVADQADPSPAPLLRNVPAALDERVRLLAPHARRGWLERGPGPDPARGNDDYVRLSWPEAIELTAAELTRCKQKYGNEAIYGSSYGWGSAGRFHHAQSQVHRFLNVLGGYVASVNSYSFGAAAPLLKHVVGDLAPITQPTAWPVLAEHTRHFVCFGGIPAKNGQVNPGGTSRHTVAEQLLECGRNGARFTLVSPLRDDLAVELGAEWLPLIPGTDTALMLALIHTLVDRELHEAEFLRTHCVGFPELWSYVCGKSDGVLKDADWAGRITGIAARTIRELAESMAARRTMITVTWSLQRSRYGEQPLWAGIALASVLGQFGLPGGGFGHGYGATTGIGQGIPHYPLPTLPQGDNPVTDFIPVARIADMLLHPGEKYEYNGERRVYPDIRLVYWAGGNPFHHHQDLGRLARAFTKPDTIITHEQFWTPTARHADIVFPATSTLERDDIGAAREDTALLAMGKITEPLGEARSDFAIFAELAARLGVEDEFTGGRDERGWLEYLYTTWRAELPAELDPGLDFTEFWERKRIEFGAPDNDRVLYRDFRADPQARPLPTPSGRIELFSVEIDGFGYSDCPGHPVWLVPEELAEPLGAGAYPLLLIANNPATRLHSQLDHGALSVESKVHGREPLRMNPADAVERGLRAGEVVLVRSEVGSVLAGLITSAELRPGIVQLSTGAWFDPSAPDVATCVHGNPNALTRDIGTSRLAQGCSGQHARVEVLAFAGTPPPVRAHTAPGA